MTLLLSEADVRETVDMARLVDMIENAVLEEHGGNVIMPPRLNLMRDETFLRLMPVYMAASGLFGYKTFHGSIERGVRYLIVLCRVADGEILALVDAAYLTAVRTGATSGVATRYLAPPGRASVGLIGSGLEAGTNLAAIAAVRPITDVRVFSRSATKRTAFAERTEKELGIPVRPVGSPVEAVRGANIVVVATNTGRNGPVAFEGAWLEPDQYVVSIGATSPFLREVDTTTFDRADHVVFDVSPEQVFEESGDLLAADEELRARLRKGARTLPSVVADGSVGRCDGQTTLFKSVGTAAQDLVAAKAVYDVARERGIGRDLGNLVQLKEF